MAQFKIEPPNRLKIDWIELWQYRELLYFFAWRDIKVKYKETVLGVVWVLLQPIVMTVIFSLIFSKGLKIATSSLPYPLFVLSGLILWGFVSACMADAAHSMELNAKIVKKIYFPRLLIPVSAVVTAAFDLLFGLCLIIAVCIIFKMPIYLQNVIFAFPISIIILALSATGFALMFSVMTAIYKDFRYIIPFFVQVLFFTSPIFYDLNNLGEGWWTEALSWNPIAGGLQIFRTIFVNNSFHFEAIVKPGFGAILIFLSGLLVFKKLEPKLADFI